MLLDQGQLCVVEVLGHIGDDTGDDGSGADGDRGDAEASGFLPSFFVALFYSESTLGRLRLFSELA